MYFYLILFCSLPFYYIKIDEDYVKNKPFQVHVTWCVEIKHVCYDYMLHANIDKAARVCKCQRYHK